MRFIEPAPPDEKYGCLLGLLGGIAGVCYGEFDFARHLARQHAENPEACHCGNGAIAAFMIYGTLGLVCGTVIGATIGYVWRVRHPTPPLE